MRRLSRIVVLVLLIELVIGAAIGTRIRKQLESPVSYLGSHTSEALRDGGTMRLSLGGLA